MNAKHFIAAVSIALAGSAAMAQEITVFDTPASTASRAEVQAELARVQGSLTVGDIAPVEQPTPSVAERNEVRAQARAEARAALHSNELNRYYSL